MPLILLFFNVTKEASSLVYTPTHSFKLKVFWKCFFYIQLQKETTEITMQTVGFSSFPTC